MPIPDFQSFFLPLLDLSADGKEHTVQEAKELIAAKMQFSREELSELLPSGTVTKFNDRIAWAKTYLTQAKVLESTRRGVFKITKRGLELHRLGYARIDTTILNQYPEFAEFRARGKSGLKVGTDTKETNIDATTPEETLQNAYQMIRHQLRTDLVNKVKQCSPNFFERLVVKLMIAMGYGGSEADAGQVLGRSGDGGIDGTIKEDRLGLDLIYLQAKRWEGVVGRPEIQKFVGALQGEGARKGVFMTTGRFSGEALEFVKRGSFKVVLIDGEQLADFMIDVNVGVTNIENFQLKKINLDDFEEV